VGVTEESLAEDIGRSFTGGAQEELKTEKTRRYDFDSSFQTKIAALVLRDPVFNERSEGLIQPEYFEHSGEAVLVSLTLKYFNKYRRIPANSILLKLLKEGIKRKVIREDLKPEILAAWKRLSVEDISDRDYVIDEVAAFAQHQALEKAILKSVEYLGRKDFENIEKVVKEAMQVGAQQSPTYDFYDEIESRTATRLESLSGSKIDSVTTGIPQIDDNLYHGGWGKSELSIYMGGAKTGKTTALINSALSASLAGYNVLYVTLEVSKEIAATRADANLADITMNDLKVSPHAVKTAVEHIRETEKVGAFKIHEYPSGTMTPTDLRRLIEHYKAKSLLFELIVIDYLDIMAPSYRTNDAIENSKSVWVDVRAIAQQENVAILSATQTNRDGFKASVAKAEHVAEDFNKIRIADLVISINKSEDEAMKDEARLYFAASRNQASGFMLYVKQDLAKMKFVTKVLKRE